MQRPIAVDVKHVHRLTSGALHARQRRMYTVLTLLMASGVLRAGTLEPPRLPHAQ